MGIIFVTDEIIWAFELMKINSWVRYWFNYCLGNRLARWLDTVSDFIKVIWVLSVCMDRIGVSILGVMLDFDESY